MNPNTHFYLYAKGWYIKCDPIDDLRIIMGNYAGLRPDQVSENDILNRLTSLAWYEINMSGNPENYFHNFITHILQKDIITACLYLLDVSPSGEKNREQLGRPNEDILPINSESKSQMNKYNYLWAD